MNRSKRIPIPFQIIIYFSIPTVRLNPLFNIIFIIIDIISGVFFLCCFFFFLTSFFYHLFIFNRTLKMKPVCKLGRLRRTKPSHSPSPLLLNPIPSGHAGSATCRLWCHQRPISTHRWRHRPPIQTRLVRSLLFAAAALVVFVVVICHEKCNDCGSRVTERVTCHVLTNVNIPAIRPGPFLLVSTCSFSGNIFYVLFKNKQTNKKKNMDVLYIPMNPIPRLCNLKLEMFPSTLWRWMLRKREREGDTGLNPWSTIWFSFFKACGWRWNILCGLLLSFDHLPSYRHD